MKRSSKKGFTLAELLIVIAIIAILIAIMFPVFGAQLNKAKAAAELANVRAKYSEMVADAMLGDDNNLTSETNFEVTINIKDLAKAMQQGESKLTFTPGTDSEGEIKVEYKGYSGSFKTDADVNFTDGANQITIATTVDKDGNSPA